jgi:hypothetical protein
MITSNTIAPTTAHGCQRNEQIGELVGGGSLVSFDRHRAIDRSCDMRGHLRCQLQQRWHRRKQCALRFLARPLAGRRFVERGTETIDIARRCRHAFDQRFGRCICRRADELARHRQ